MDTADHWRAFVEESQKEVKGIDSRGETQGPGGPPIVWIPDGTTKLRFYIDKRRVPLRLIRKLYLHRAVEANKVKVRCVGESCQVCKAVKSAAARGYEGSWRFAARLIGLAYGYIYDSTDQSEYMVTKQAVALVLHSRIVEQINRLIASYNANKAAQVFDPDRPSFLIVIMHKGGRGGKTNVGIDPDIQSLPAFPDDYPDLDEIYVKSSDPPKEEDVRTILEEIEQKTVEVTRVQQAAKAGGAPSGLDEPVQLSLAPSPPNSTEQPPRRGVPGLVGPKELPAGIQRPPRAPECFGAHPPKESPHIGICVLCVDQLPCLDVQRKIAALSSK